MPPQNNNSSPDLISAVQSIAQVLSDKTQGYKSSRYYAYQVSNMGTTSASFVDFTPVATLVTRGGAIEAELFAVAYVTSGTGFFALKINGVDYDCITLSNTAEVGYWGKVLTPSLPAGTYTIQMRGRSNGTASLNVPAFRSQTIYAREVFL